MSGPTTRRGGTVETLHGHEVADPYRWLEDPDSEETRAWVSAQNRHSRPHLDGLAARGWFGATMDQVTRMPRAGTPTRVGERYVVSRNDGSLQQDQWYVAETLEELRAGGRLLLDPNELSADGTASLAWFDESRDGALLAYQVSEGGSDWTTVRVRDVATGVDLDDVLTKVKFSEATWLPDGRSFLYLHFPTSGAGRGTEAEALPAGRLRRHVLGTAQDEDETVWEMPDLPRVIPEPHLTHDGRWLVLHLAEGTSERNRLWVLPVTPDGEGASRIGEPVRLVDDERAMLRAVRVAGDRLLVHTDLHAPLGRVASLPLPPAAGPATADGPADGPADPADAADVLDGLREVVAEQEGSLQVVVAAGEELLTVHLLDAQPRVTRWTTTGDRVAEVEVTGGSLVALRGRPGVDEVFLGLTSVTARVSAHRLALADGRVTRLDGLAPPVAGSWTAPAVRTERRRARSADGTDVGYFLVRPEGVGDEPRPTLLWGYGGFSIALVAEFRPLFAGWLAAGGTLVVANLRGGSEHGSAWHEAGRLHHKQNVFDDYAAVADHLVDSGVTTRAQLALHGRSNGGLLVAATLTQRPDLCAAAIPAVGVLDMLRFHLFTVGAAWISDYGTPEDAEDFATLLAYSPLHNVREGTAYPATLVVTGDHDDRVVPAHSFKLTAALQHAQAGDAPVLARIETSAGHGTGTPAAVVAAEAADILAFAAEHTGLVPPG